MYRITEDQLLKLNEVLQHVDTLTLTGINNFISGTNIAVKLQFILEEIKKQEIKEGMINVSQPNSL